MLNIYNSVTGIFLKFSESQAVESKLNQLLISIFRDKMLPKRTFNVSEFFNLHRHNCFERNCFSISGNRQQAIKRDSVWKVDKRFTGMVEVFFYQSFNYFYVRYHF